MLNEQASSDPGWETVWEETPGDYCGASIQTQPEPNRFADVLTTITRAMRANPRSHAGAWVDELDDLIREAGAALPAPRLEGWQQPTCFGHATPQPMHLLRAIWKCELCGSLDEIADMPSGPTEA